MKDEERLGAALRENLKRRKAQARARSEVPPAPEQPRPRDIVWPDEAKDKERS